MTATAPQARPKASFTQWYGPPSAGKAAEVSEKTRAYGTRKASARKLAQTTPSPPPEAISPIVSMLMTAATMKKTMSARPSVRRSRVCCSAARAVWSPGLTSDIGSSGSGWEHGPRRQAVDDPPLPADSTEPQRISEAVDDDA